MNILEVEGLCKTYPAFALRDVSFAVEPGTIMGFIGRNGAGKSTTIKSMLNLVHPDSGRVTMFGQDFYANEPACKQQLGVVLGGVDFYPNKKLRSITNVTRTFYDRWDEDKYRHYLQLFALDETKKVSQLSSGMRVKYMLALARSRTMRACSSLTSRRADSTPCRATSSWSCFAAWSKAASAASCFRRISRPISKSAPRTSR